MNNNYFEYIDTLNNDLKDSDFNSLEITKYFYLDFPSVFERPLALTVEAYVFGGGVSVQNRVDIHGDEHSVRTLGLILISRAISAPVPAMLLRLETRSEINLIYLEPIEGQLNFYDCVPTVLKYIFCAATDEYSREGMIVRDIDRPSFGYLTKKNKVECLAREIPEWARNALIIDGTANSALRLGAMLLDLTHPSRPGGGLMHLQRRFDQVCAMTYSIDWELRLTD
jgi:hypothetical protein